MPLPLGKVAHTLRGSAEAVPDLALQRKARLLTLVPTAGDRLLPGDNRPRLTREKPAAAQRGQKRRDRMLHAGRIVPNEQEAIWLAADDESFAAQLFHVIELPPGE